VLLAAKALFSVLLLIWVLRKTPVAEVLAALRSADISLVVLAAAMCALGHGLSIGRWRILLRAQNVRPPYRELLSSYGTAVFLNNLLPSTVGGDAIRAYDSWRFGSSQGGALAAVLMDRLFGLIALALFALAAMLAWQGLGARLGVSPGVPAAVVAGVLALPAALALLAAAVDPERAARWPLLGAGRAARILQQLSRAFAAFQGQPAALARVLVVSLLLQLNVVLYYYVLSRALGLELALPPFFLIVPLLVLAMMLPVSINGVGLRENALSLLLSAFEVASAPAVALAWLDYGLTLCQGAVGGVAYFHRK
jgi:uncharacterized membrane protein YbhN (UPF0104 family)